MKQSLKNMFYLGLLLSGAGSLIAAGTTSTSQICDPCVKTDDCDPCDSDECLNCCQAPIRTYIHFRSQGANTARELVGWQWELNKPFMCENYGTAYLAYNYQRNFRPERIANQLFGGCCLKFAGSNVADRDPRCELLADNFGLSSNFRGNVTFCPRYENHIVDLGLYYGLDCFWQGSYLRIHFPITHTRWDLRACECVDTTSPAIAPCYVGSNSTANDLFFDLEPTPAIQTLQEALCGITPFGDKKENWCAGRIDFCRRTRTRVADIDFILGYNWLNNDCYHLGFYLQAVLPTGGKPRNLFLFDPVVGNGGHFELGGGISAHAVLWACGDHNLAFFLEGNVTHMFRNRQCRLFDLCKNGPFSRYLLLKEFDSNGTVNTYNGNLVSATCFTNRLVNVRVDVKGDASIKLAYRWCGWGFDLGYNIYGHSREKIDFRCDDLCCDIDSRKFCIKGTQGVCCSEYPVLQTSTETPEYKIFPDNTQTGLTGSPSVPSACPPLSDTVARVTIVPNNTCQPCATAFEGKPVPGGNAVTVSSTNSNVPCAVALAYNSKPVTNPNGSPTPGVQTTTQNAPSQLANRLTQEGFILCNNQNPVTFLDAQRDLDKKSAEAVSVFTHKIFAHWSYTWYDECAWNPSLGVGAEVEFDGNKKNREICKTSNLNLWGVWIKGNISF